MLPNEVLLDVLMCLRRNYLDDLPLAGRRLLHLIDTRNETLPQRLIDKVMVYIPSIELPLAPQEQILALFDGLPEAEQSKQSLSVPCRFGMNDKL